MRNNSNINKIYFSIAKMWGVGLLASRVVGDLHIITTMWLLIIGYSIVRIMIHRVAEHINARRTAYRRHLVRKYSAKYVR